MGVEVLLIAIWIWLWFNMGSFFFYYFGFHLLIDLLGRKDKSRGMKFHKNKNKKRDFEQV